MVLQLKIDATINILVQRRAAIGDVIMSTGVVRELKRRYGDNANIDVATDCLEVYRNNPHVRGIIPVQAADPSKYDVYINLDDAYEKNPDAHYVESYFYRAFADPTKNMAVELFPSAEDCSMVDADLTEIGDRFIVVHMRNWHWPAKNIEFGVWMDVFAHLFAERTDFKVVCVGGSTDHALEHPLFFDARDRYNSQQIKYLCDHARCFVGIDSGPFQCAAASSTHIIGLLTHLDPDCIMPHRKYELGYNSTAIPTEEDCRGCNRDQQRPVRQLICKKGNTPCNANFDIDVIANAILKQL